MICLIYAVRLMRGIMKIDEYAIISLNKFKNEMAIQTNLITRYTELLCLLFRYYIEGGKSCLIFGNLVHVALLAVGGS